jgi:hypothetical protein
MHAARQNERNKAQNQKGQGHVREKLTSEEEAAADAAQAAFDGRLGDVQEKSGIAAYRDAIIAVVAIVFYLVIGFLFYGGHIWFSHDSKLEWTFAEVAYFAFATITTGTNDVSTVHCRKAGPRTAPLLCGADLARATTLCYLSVASVRPTMSC